MTLTTLDNVLWAAGFIGHVALFLVLVVRGRIKNIPYLHVTDRLRGTDHGHATLCGLALWDAPSWLLS